MRKQIYEFIKQNSPTSSNNVAIALNLDGDICLKTIEILRQECFIKLCPPLKLSIDNNCSCLYVATDKIWKDVF